LDNKQLASLPRDHFELLAPLLTSVSLGQGIVLAEPGDEFDHVYFPHSGMLSLLAVMRDGKAIETATVGREGLVGGMAGLGLCKSLLRVVVQLGGSGCGARIYGSQRVVLQPMPRSGCICRSLFRVLPDVAVEHGGMRSVIATVAIRQWMRFGRSSKPGNSNSSRYPADVRYGIVL
jgi:CRP-like cAMP-binding protein